MVSSKSIFRVTQWNILSLSMSTEVDHYYLVLFRAIYTRCCGLNGQNGCDNSKWTRWIGDLYS